MNVERYMVQKYGAYTRHRMNCATVVGVSIGGCAIVQAVSRWLPTAAARVWSSGICGGQSGAEVGFL
jgi:hypothetical protein